MATEINNKTPNNAIVVAIGPDGSKAAIAFGVDAARRTHRPLHVVHCVQVNSGEEYLGMYGGVLETANATLEQAMRHSRELAAGDVVVTGDRVDGSWLVGGLVLHSNEGSMVVLEHRHQKALARLVTGSFTSGVAARARVPVVSVPEGWTKGPDRGVVTAAVQDPTEASLVLRTAFAEASLRGANVVVLHAWWLSSGYDAVAVDQVYRDEWQSRTQKELDPVLAEARAAFPDVDATVEVRHAPPVEAVLDATASSDLVVIGRRHHLLPLGTHLGPVARAALNHGECPVIVTPEVGVDETSAPIAGRFVTVSV